MVSSAYNATPLIRYPVSLHNAFLLIPNFYNDNFTTMEFVVDILVSIFNKSRETAEELMMQVHTEGSSIVGVYTYDIAVSRTNLAIQAARKNGYPLRVEIE